MVARYQLTGSEVRRRCPSLVLRLVADIASLEQNDNYPPKSMATGVFSVTL